MALICIPECHFATHLIPGPFFLRALLIVVGRVVKADGSAMEELTGFGGDKMSRHREILNMEKYELKIIN